MSRSDVAGWGVGLVQNRPHDLNIFIATSHHFTMQSSHTILIPCSIYYQWNTITQWLREYIHIYTTNIYIYTMMINMYVYLEAETSSGLWCLAAGWRLCKLSWTGLWWFSSKKPWMMLLYYIVWMFCVADEFHSFLSEPCSAFAVNDDVEDLYI